MKKYFITKDDKSFHVFCRGLTDIEKEKYQNHLKQDYNMEISYELLLKEQKKNQKK